MLVVQYGLFVFPDNVALVVLLDSMPCLWLSGFWVVDGNDLLRRARFATGINACGFHWTKNSASSSARSARDQTHNLALSLGGLRRDDLPEHFRLALEFQLRLHQLAFNVRNRRSGQRHLQRSHLSGITLAVTHQCKIVTGH